MDTPSSFIPHEHPLVGVEECRHLMGHISLGAVCLWDRTNLGMQAT